MKKIIFASALLLAVACNSGSDESAQHTDTAMNSNDNGVLNSQPGGNADTSGGANFDTSGTADTSRHE